MSGSPIAMLIRIFGKKDHEPYGDIIHCDLRKPVPYQGAAELVLRIDAISRSLDLTDSGSAFRSIKKNRGGNENMLPEEYRKNEAVGKGRRMPGDHLLESPVILDFPESAADRNAALPPGVQDTIYLQLVGRQNTSIQGRIWGRITKKRYISFRSALELICLLSEAV